MLSLQRRRCNQIRREKPVFYGWRPLSLCNAFPTARRCVRSKPRTQWLSQLSRGSCCFLTLPSHNENSSKESANRLATLSPNAWERMRTNPVGRLGKKIALRSSYTPPIKGVRGDSRGGPADIYWLRAARQLLCSAWQRIRLSVGWGESQWVNGWEQGELGWF